MPKPSVNNCVVCVRIARRTKPGVRAVISPTGKAHWCDKQGVTFCGKDALVGAWDAK